MVWSQNPYQTSQHILDFKMPVVDNKSTLILLVIHDAS